MPSSLIRGQSPLGIRPVIGGGTGSSTQAGAATNLDVVSNTDHPTLHLDDSLIYLNSIAVFNTTTGTRANVQAAYNSGVRCVFLRPGQYNWDTTPLQVPYGGQLRGLGIGIEDSSPSGSYGALITFTGSASQGIVFQGGGLCENIMIQANSRTVTSNGNTAAAIYHQGTDNTGYLTVRNVAVYNWATNQSAQYTPAFSLRYGRLTNCRSHNSSCGFFVQAEPSYSASFPTVLDNCYSYNSINTNASQGDFLMNGGWYRMLNCMSFSSGNAGFWDSQGTGEWHYLGCRAESSAGDGFHLVVSASNAVQNLLQCCYAFNNGGVGISMTSGGANGSAFSQCWAGGNTGGNYLATNVNQVRLDVCF